MNRLKDARIKINEIDSKMAELFTERMHIAEEIAAVKQEMGLPILDIARETEMVEANCLLITDEALRSYYSDFLQHNMSLSRRYQHRLMKGMRVANSAVSESFANIEAANKMIIPVDLGEESYNIYFERGALQKADGIFNLDRRVLIVSDDGVPKQYIDTVASQCTEPYIEIFPQGEQSKNMQTYQNLLARMVSEGFSRADCVVALGGGVTGDMAGFAAASYMRGIDFYNIPTTLLSQVDSSIGGKVALDFMGCKNIVGAFYQPKAVLIDCDVLATLEPRHIANGYAEIIKIAACCDKSLFEKLERNEKIEALDEIIASALMLKKNIIEQDESESGLRRVLNFGHTLGHAIESATGFEKLYHGECVGLGMLGITEGKVRERITALLEKYELPTSFNCDKQAVLSALTMDKKKEGSEITVVRVDEIGSFRFEKLPIDNLKNRLEEVL